MDISQVFQSIIERHLYVFVSPFLVYLHCMHVNGKRPILIGLELDHQRTLSVHSLLIHQRTLFRSGINVQSTYNIWEKIIVIIRLPLQFGANLQSAYSDILRVKV